MRNWPSENFAHKEQAQEIKNLSPEWQKTLNDAILQMKNNPEISENIKSDFSDLFENLAKNPETAHMLDAKVTDNMHNKLNTVKAQHANGEIYKDEAISMSREAIKNSTEQRMQIFAIQYGFSL